MSSAQLNGAGKDGDALIADWIKVRGGVLLDSSGDGGAFTAAGAIRLAGADITGGLIMSSAQLNGAGKDGNALAADRIKVGGNVNLSASTTALGAIWLAGADITGQLIMSGAKLNGTDKDGNALIAEGIKVGGGVFLNSSGDGGAFTAAGAIRLAGAGIAGQLSMSGAKLNGANKKGYALVADGTKVSGDVFLDSLDEQKTFTAKGTVSLKDAQVGASLRFTGAELLAEAGKGSLSAEGMQVRHKLIWCPAKPVHGQVNLEGAATAELDDDWDGRNNGYWPSDLRLDGFTYATVNANNTAKVDQRLDWIRGKNKGRTQSRGQAEGATSDTGAAFASRPYEQLFQMYQRAGNDTDARHVAIAERRDQRQLGKLRWHRKAFNLLLDITIGYGYQTWRALVLLAGLYMIVLAVSIIALHHNGSIVPVPQNAMGIQPRPSALLCMRNYPCFNPVGYAFDTVVPIINLHQADYWRPNSGVPWGDVCTWVSWAGTVVGWLLVTLAVAGFTGLARRVDAP